MSTYLPSQGVGWYWTARSGLSSGLQGTCVCWQIGGWGFFGGEGGWDIAHVPFLSFKGLGLGTIDFWGWCSWNEHHTFPRVHVLKVWQILWPKGHDTVLLNVSSQESDLLKRFFVVVFLARYFLVPQTTFLASAIALPSLELKHWAAQISWLFLCCIFVCLIAPSPSPSVDH